MGGLVINYNHMYEVRNKLFVTHHARQKYSQT